jgi:tetratricopeptide (TPR) repeat protein
MRRSVASATDARPPAAPTASPREFIATFAVLFGLILAFLVLDLSLARVERNEARQHAANLFQEGRAQLDSGHPGEAADRLSAAVSLDRSNVAYALGLAQAMAAEGRAADAEQMLGGLLERAQNDGAVNLTMARLLATTHRPRDAAAFYHRAIYGRWGADSTLQRTAARFELIYLLDKQRARAELLAELLPLQSDSADSTALLTRVAPLYLSAAAPNRAADAYRALIRRSPDDAAAYVGLGDAALALGQFVTARSAFREAARMKASDTMITRRLELADTLLALDPTARGLSDSQRLSRSRVVLALTTAAIDGCPHGVETPPGSAVRDSALAELRRPASPGDLASAAERSLTLAGVVWRSRSAACVPDSSESSEVLVLLQRSLAR